LYGLPEIRLAASIARLTSGGASTGGIAMPLTSLALPVGRNCGSSGNTPPVVAVLEGAVAAPDWAAEALVGTSAKAATANAAAGSI
jgi:hypothetical protein